MAEKIQMGGALEKRVEEFRLNLTDYAEDIESLGDELAELVEWARGLWYERSERWQEGDRGTATNDWIDTIEALADKITQLGTDANEIVAELTDVETEPNFEGI